MPDNDQRGRLPRSSKPGRPLIWKWPEGTLAIQWASDQDINLDFYTEPNNDRRLRPIAMPSVIRLVYDRTEFDSDPIPAGFLYYGITWSTNPDTSWVAAAAASLGMTTAPFSYTANFQDFCNLWNSDSMSLDTFSGGAPTFTTVSYLDFDVPKGADYTSGDDYPPDPGNPPPLVTVQTSYVDVFIINPDNPAPGVLYYSGPSSGMDGQAFIGIPFQGPPL